MNPIINRKQDILYKDLAVDLTAHRVSRAGHELMLTPREFALLAVLVTHCDTALSRSQLLEAAWGYAFIGESRTVDVHINRLRRKLGLQNDIQTVYKVGCNSLVRYLLISVVLASMASLLVSHE